MEYKKRIGSKPFKSSGFKKTGGYAPKFGTNATGGGQPPVRSFTTSSFESKPFSRMPNNTYRAGADASGGQSRPSGQGFGDRKPSGSFSKFGGGKSNFHGSAGSFSKTPYGVKPKPRYDGGGNRAGSGDPMYESSTSAHSFANRFQKWPSKPFESRTSAMNPYNKPKPSFGSQSFGSRPVGDKRQNPRFAEAGFPDAPSGVSGSYNKYKTKSTADGVRRQPSMNTSWGEEAKWYNELLENGKDTYQSEVILPNLLRLVKPEKGMVVADIACGQGYFSRQFAAAGALVIGSDVSAELIRIATESAGGPEYHNVPADNLSFIKNSSVNVATIVLAIQNIEHVAAVFAEASRILRKDGKLFVVLNHPAFRIPKKSGWGWDEEGVQYRKVDGYMSESRTEIDMHPGSLEKSATVSFHRPLQYYFKALEKTGLVVSRMEEWISHKTSTGPRAPFENKARNEIPMFMMLECRKG
jgi:SAM-dependent methyltransferase